MIEASRRAYRDKNVMGRFMESVYITAEGYKGPIRLMGIECGGVHTTLRIYEYLRDIIDNIGYFSVDVNRKDGEIKNKKKIERELSVYPDFLKDSLLISVDDIVLDGNTIDIVKKEAEVFFKPKFGVSDFKYAAVVSSVSEGKKPYADIYGTVVDDADRMQHIKSLHLSPHLKGVDSPETSLSEKYVMLVSDWLDKMGRRIRYVNKLKENMILSFLQKNEELVSELTGKLEKNAKASNQLELF